MKKNADGSFTMTEAEQRSFNRTLARVLLQNRELWAAAEGIMGVKLTEAKLLKFMQENEEPVTVNMDKAQLLKCFERAEQLKKAAVDTPAAAAAPKKTRSRKKTT